VRLLLLDVDGVLTDGTIYLDANGVETKGCSIQDGLGLSLLKGAGIGLGIITGRTSKVVELRARELGMSHVVQGCGDKAAAAAEILGHEGLGWEALAYVGDDLIDLPVLSRAGLAAAPGDAAPQVRQAVHHVARAPGGRGAVREVCELILMAQGRWEAALERFPCG